MRKLLYRFYWFLEKRIVPGLRSSQYAYHERLKSAVQPNFRWLDLGCGHQVFADWMKREQAELIAASAWVVGTDLDLESMRAHPGIRDRVQADLEQLPFRAASFDLVTANMVVEHLTDPAEVLRAVRKVMRNGGLLVFHTSNYWNYWIWVAARTPRTLKNLFVKFFENRNEEDVYPTHYRFNTLPEVQRIAASEGFRIVDLQLVSSSALTVALGPLVAIELLAIRACGWKPLQRFRTNIIGVLQKSDDRGAEPESI